jgi:hypothetical protein
VYEPSSMLAGRAYERSSEHFANRRNIGTCAMPLCRLPRLSYSALGTRFTPNKRPWLPFHATKITAYLEADGTLENAQNMAAHESPRTTNLYDRTGDAIILDEVERIKI